MICQVNAPISATDTAYKSKMDHIDDWQQYVVKVL